MSVGGISSAYLEEYYTPYHVFFLSSSLIFVVAFASCFLSDELETNKYATMLDTTEQEYRSRGSGQDSAIPRARKLGCCEITKIRLESLKEAVKEPVVQKFYLFLILQGFMPDFSEFNYFFVLDVLKISKFDYSLSTVISSAMAIATPVIFHKLLTTWSYKNLFFIAQIINVIQAALLLLLITRCNSYFGLSDMFMFLFTGSFAESVERIMTMLPSFIIMAKIIKPGVEGTMLALTGTIINMN